MKVKKYISLTMLVDVLQCDELLQFIGESYNADTHCAMQELIANYLPRTVSGASLLRCGWSGVEFDSVYRIYEIKLINIEVATLTLEVDYSALSKSCAN